MSPATNELEKSLSDLGSALEERFPSRSGTERDELLARILTDSSEPKQERAVRGRSVWVKVALATTVAAAAALVISLVLPADEQGPFAPPSASGALRKLSLLQRAYKSEDPPLAPGQFYYRSSQGYANYGESWFTRKGTGGYRAKALDEGRKLKLVHRDKANGIFLGNLELTYSQMLALPRDPDRLFEIIKGAALPGDQEQDYKGGLGESQTIFRAIESFLIEAPAPASVKASFYEVLSRMSYIHLIGAAETQDGREGVAVGMWFNGGPDTDKVVRAADGTILNERDDLIFDRKTGELIGDRTVLNGDVEGQSFQTGVVDRLGERPPGIEPPPPLARALGE